MSIWWLQMQSNMLTTFWNALHITKTNMLWYTLIAITMNSYVHVYYLYTLFTHATATGVLVRQTLSTTLASVGWKILCNFRLISTKYSLWKKRIEYEILEWHSKMIMMVVKPTVKTYRVFWKISRRLISRSFPFRVNTVLLPAFTKDTRDDLPILDSQSFQASTFSDKLNALPSLSKLEYTKNPDFCSRGTSITKVIFLYEKAQIPIKSRDTESLEFKLISWR